jgi:hypothetical protein
MPHLPNQHCAAGPNFASPSSPAALLANIADQVHLQYCAECARFTFFEKLAYQRKSFENNSTMNVTLGGLQAFSDVVDTGSTRAAAPPSKPDGVGH